MTDADIQAEGTKFAVRHRTVFQYPVSVWNSVNTVHLVPRDFRCQRTISAYIKVLPATRLRRFDDLFGNVTHHFEINKEHSRLEIESNLKVSNLPLLIPDEGYSGGMRFYSKPAIRESCCQYLQESRWVSTHPDLWKQAVDLTIDKPAAFEKAAAIMRWIYAEFSYEPGSTDVDTHSEQSFRSRTGVCQDFTHVMLGMCRTIGLPARYASGYIYTGGKDVLIGAQASHAWCEICLPATGWIGFDPTNAVLADDRYIKIAVGRDYTDVTPVHGTYNGTSACGMDVSVFVEKL